MSPKSVAKQETKRVGIWVRVSTEDQADGESPEHHEKRGHCYADSKGWHVIEVYMLSGVSGKSVIAEGETQRMIHDIKRGHISGLIFSKLARLARNTKELLEFAEIFEAHEAHLISLQESIDTSTPVGRFFYTLIAAMAQWEREEITERIRASVPIRAKLGKPLSGNVPFGYQIKDKKLVPHLTEAPIRKLIYELFLEHQRKRTVATVLNRSGYRTRNGKLFSPAGINHILRDSAAKGLYRANYSREGAHGGRELKPESEWVYTAVEPIVPEELWTQCNRILEEQSSGRKRPARRVAHLFAGVAYCDCGDKMYVRPEMQKYICRKCRNKIPAVDLEAVYQEQLRTFFVSPDEIAEFLSQSDRTIRDKEKLLHTIKSEEAHVREEIDGVYRLYTTHRINEEGFSERYDPLEERRRQLDDEIPRLQGEIDYLKINLLSSDEVVYEARDLCERWPSLEQSDKRKIIETITDRITIGRGDITIEFCYFPSSKLMLGKGNSRVAEA